MHRTFYSLALVRIILSFALISARKRKIDTVTALNSSLNLPMSPFRLARRRVVIDQLMLDPAVSRAVRDHARRNEISRADAQDTALRYAQEIVPGFSPYMYFAIGARLARSLSNLVYRIRIGSFAEGELSRVNSEFTVVFVMNHRSRMDYLLLTYLMSQNSALSFAVNEWARVWPLESLFRGMGAFFVRQDLQEPLYQEILARFVGMSTAAGVPQVLFPEAEPTRDGCLSPPKPEMLSYIVSTYDPRADTDILFIPVGINYDRVLEDRFQTSGRSQFDFKANHLLGLFLRFFASKVCGRFYRLGYACASYGVPMSLRGYLAERGDIDLRTLRPERFNTEVAHLAQVLMNKVAKIVPALPVALVATVIVENERKRATEAQDNSSGGGCGSLSSLELKGRVSALIRRLEANGGYVHVPRHDQEYAIEVGLRILLARHLVIMDGGLIRANEKECLLLDYYANSIKHLLDDEKASRRQSHGLSGLTGASP